jgi:hypothetical protein
MRFSSYPQPLIDRLTLAGRAATNDTADEIRSNQARRSGRLAAGTRVLGDFRLGSWSIYNTEVYADAVEHGANARVKASVRAGTKRSRSKKLGDMQGPLRARATRRGPHMAGNHVVADHGPSFLEHMPRRLRELSR